MVRSSSQQGISGNIGELGRDSPAYTCIYRHGSRQTRAKSIPVRGLPRREKPRCGVYLLLSMCQAFGGMSGTGWPGQFWTGTSRLYKSIRRWIQLTVDRPRTSSPSVASAASFACWNRCVAGLSIRLVVAHPGRPGTWEAGVCGFGLRNSLRPFGDGGGHSSWPSDCGVIVVRLVNTLLFQVHKTAATG